MSSISNGQITLKEHFFHSNTYLYGGKSHVHQVLGSTDEYKEIHSKGTTLYTKELRLYLQEVKEKQNIYMELKSTNLLSWNRFENFSLFIISL